MKWLTAWWHQIVGPPHIDPWEHDPRIRAEREAQHDRMDKAAGVIVRDEWNQRVRDSWRPKNGGH